MSPFVIFCSHNQLSTQSDRQTASLAACGHFFSCCVLMLAVQRVVRVAALQGHSLFLCFPPSLGHMVLLEDDSLTFSDMNNKSLTLFGNTAREKEHLQ